MSNWCLLIIASSPNSLVSLWFSKCRNNSPRLSGRVRNKATEDTWLTGQCFSMLHWKPEVWPHGDLTIPTQESPRACAYPSKLNGRWHWEDGGPSFANPRLPVWGPSTDLVQKRPENKLWYMKETSLCKYLPHPLRLLWFSGSQGLRRRCCWSMLSSFVPGLKMKSCSQSQFVHS